MEIGPQSSAGSRGGDDEREAVVLTKKSGKRSTGSRCGLREIGGLLR
jgi:hypothetical protein